MNDDELKKKALQFLYNLQEEPQKGYEFSARELSEELGKWQHNVYPYMKRLVDNGLWGTRIAMNPQTGKHIRVWWLIEKE